MSPMCSRHRASSCRERRPFDRRQHAIPPAQYRAVFVGAGAPAGLSVGGELFQKLVYRQPAPSIDPSPRGGCRGVERTRSAGARQ
jgi:hypothetical protein